MLAMGPSLKAGDAFGRYVVEALLGEGGMGQVYRAYDPLLERRVAIKLLRDPGAAATSGGSEGPARILREARAAAQLHHPNATTIFDVGEVDGVPYLTMELIAGRPLGAFVADDDVSTEVRLGWLGDVARALAAAHERGLVHRDVKLENVMVRTDGVVKVLDFGIARRGPTDVNPLTATAPAIASTPNVTGGVSGTPLYMSPEQLRGEPVDGRADQFAWGVLAYTLLTRRFPWSEPGDVVRAIADVLSMTPAPMASSGVRVPPGVEEVVLRALRKSREDRFPEMRALLAALEPARATPSLPPSDASGRVIVSVEGSAAVTTGGVTAKYVPAAPGSSPGAASARGSSRSRWILAAAALALVGATSAWVLRARMPRGAPASASSSGSASGVASASASATVVTGLPRPTTLSAEAASAHDEGMQGIRDANFDVALRAFQRAAKADPGFAAAWMRVALVGYGVLPLSEVREAFRNANERRAALSERDRAFLGAFEPFVAREPADLAESERRLVAAVARWPLDAELVEALAYVQLQCGEFAAVIATAERAIAIDPDFADPWSLEGNALAQLGRFSESLATLERCAERFPAATDCLTVQTAVLEQQGQCADLEKLARRWLGKQPTSPAALGALASAMIGNGKHPDTVVAVLEQRWARIGEAEPGARARVELADRLPLDVLAGDFAAAERRAAALEALTAADSDEASHVAPASYAIELLHERGRDLEAGDLAARYLRRREAWIVDAGSEVARDPTPRMLRAASRSQRIGVAELVTARNAFLDRWRSTLPTSLRGRLWIAGWAQVAETPQLAREALAALPAYAPLPPFVARGLADADVGRVHLLAADPAKATISLRRATLACGAYKEPFAHTRAFADLGEALEAQGDSPGACAAYAVVTARWGGVVGRSVTAERVRARVAALRCVAK
jgi:serine/threonine-protein kinase